MMRSMFSGVSGLKNHNTRMDVIGNNIANVNTTGFKASRVIFEDMISQNMSGASAPRDNVGGTNPKQVGLGVSTASIDLLFKDGSVQGTGKNTDLALAGDALFVVNRGGTTYYTRNGAFEFDAEGNYVLPGSGLYVQGWMGQNGEIDTNGATTNIKIPAGKSMDATITSRADYTLNLNASTTGYDVSNIVVNYADGTSETTPNYSPVERGTISLTLSTGETVAVEATTGYPFAVGGTVTGKDLYTSTVTSVTALTGGTVDLNMSVDPNAASGPLQVNGGSVRLLNDVTSGTYSVGGTFTFAQTITAVNAVSADQVELTLSDDNTPATGITTVRVPNPTAFTYKVGDTYTGSLIINSMNADNGALITTANGVTTPLTATSFNINTGTTFTRTGVAADGTITAISRSSDYTFNGKKVSGITLNTQNGVSISGLVAESYANGNTEYSPVTTTLDIYDSLGAKHSVPVLFTKAANNTWGLSLGSGSNSYTINESDGTTTTVTLSSTSLIFDTSGGYVSGTGSLALNYTNGAAAQTVSLNLATLTQYSGTSTIVGTANGNAAGTLTSVSFDNSGTITGIYSNGVRQNEAQVAVAQFNNSTGLTKTGGSLYQESNNSGVANIKTASDFGVVITPSSLEMSNVDIADQFSDMIITQRGFQSNSKIITVSDEMLETLINMKR